MKEVNEYIVEDWHELKTQALKMAMAAIHAAYDENKDAEEISSDDLHSVKKSVEIIQAVLDIKL